ncbi:hypothetical protein ACQKIC_10665 [Peribacillus sp. NPDC046944]|uniref:hypothetical protein n=1 Tax=unclassified Peribacillus TaxID=2675266 RepID=UPI003890209A
MHRIPQYMVGIYTGVTIPYIGYIGHFVNSRETSALLLILPGVLLFCNAGFTIWQTLRGIGSKEESEGTISFSLFIQFESVIKLQLNSRSKIKSLKKGEKA